MQLLTFGVGSATGGSEGLGVGSGTGSGVGGFEGLGVGSGTGGSVGFLDGLGVGSGTGGGVGGREGFGVGSGTGAFVGGGVGSGTGGSVGSGNGGSVSSYLSLVLAPWVHENHNVGEHIDDVLKYEAKLNYLPPVPQILLLPRGKVDESKTRSSWSLYRSASSISLLVLNPCACSGRLVDRWLVDSCLSSASASSPRCGVARRTLLNSKLLITTSLMAVRDNPIATKKKEIRFATLKICADASSTKWRDIGMLCRQNWPGTFTGSRSRG